MNKEADILERFRSAISAIEERIAEAESRVDLELIQKLREERESDLKEIAALRNEISELTGGKAE